MVVTRPVKELCAFTKLNLKAGEIGVAKVFVPYEDLSFYDVKNKKFKTEKGSLIIYAANSSQDLREKTTVTVPKDFFFDIPVKL